MGIPREILIRGYLAAEYRRALGRGIAVVNRRRQLARGDGARSRVGTAPGDAEQVIAQRGVDANLGKVRGADRNTVVDTFEGRERPLADARYVPGNHQIGGRRDELLERLRPDRGKTLGKNQGSFGTTGSKRPLSDGRELGAGFKCDRR